MPTDKKLLAEGMHSDNEISLQPPNSYRNAQNMRLVSNGNDTYSLVSIDGNEVSFSTCNAGFIPIGWASYVDIVNGKREVIVFSTNSLSGGAAEIGIIQVGANTGPSTYTPIYYSPSKLNFAKEHPIINESIAIRESEEIKRVYWTDNFNKPRVLNISDVQPVGNTEIEDGVTYLVTCGTVTRTSPSGTFTVGQTFVGSSSSSYSYASDTYVVPYIEEEKLDWHPDKTTGIIKQVFTWDTGGTLNAGVYQFAYRLSLNEGYNTSWSYLTSPVPVGPEEFGSLSGNPQLAYQQYQGDISDVVTSKMLEIEVNGVDTLYDYIELVAIRATADGVTDDPKIIFKSPVSGANMSFTYTGNENLGTVISSELLSAVTVLKTVKSINANSNILFSGNITEREELGDWNPNDTATLEPFLYSVVSDTRGEVEIADGQPPIWAHKAMSGTGVGSGDIRGGVSTLNNNEGQYYKLISGGPITYNGIGISAGEVFHAVRNVFTYTGTGVIRPVIRKRKYDRNGGTEWEDTITSNEFLDYKSPSVAEQLKGYMRGETYRIGFLPFDLEGNPMYVRWIGDIEIPTMRTKSTDGGSFGDNWPLIEYFHNATADNADAVLKICGIKIRNLDITDIADKISGFSIVRAPRDKQRIAHGLLFPTTSADLGVTDVHPSAWRTLDEDFYYVTGGRVLYRYVLHCPEHLFAINPINGVDFSLLDNQDEIYLEEYFTHSFIQTETNADNYYVKHYNPTLGVGGGLPTDATPGGGTRVIVHHGTVSFGDTVSNFGGFGFAFVNETKLNTSGDEGFGMPSLVLQLDGSIFETSTVGFGSNVNTSTAKALCSIIRTNNNLYGGQSESALANTTYISTGHYQEVNATVLAQIDGYITPGRYIFDNIDIFGGDTFINIFDIARIVQDNLVGGHYGFTEVFPIESEINLAYREGRHVALDGTDSALNGVSFNPSKPEQFLYNSAYSHETNDVFYPALPVNFKGDNERRTRIQFSNEKVLGESLDSWRSFPVLQFRDLEVFNGQINNLRYKNGRMFYFQHGGVGFLSVNERAVVSDILGEETRLGVGGVLDRFDERTRDFGNQNQHGLIETPDGFVWYDNVNKAMLIMGVGGELVKLNYVKGLRNYFRTNVVGQAVLSDNPIINKGICGIYDPMNEEVLITFKIQNEPLEISTTYTEGTYRGYGGYNYRCILGYTTGGSVDIDPGADTTHWELVGPSEFTIGYLLNEQKLSGFYTFYPTSYFHVDGNILMGSEGTKEVIKANTLYAIGSQVSQGNDTYVCKLEFTTGGSPTNPGSDSTHWVKINDLSEVYIHGKGDVCKFYGSVFDSSVNIVSNVARDMFKAYDTYSHIGNENMFTSIEYANTHQSLLELGTDGRYKFQNRSWRYPIPLVNYARFRDHYLSINAIRDNKDNNTATPIITSLNTKIKVVSFDLGFRLSK